jgi:hypothetical protein
MDNGLLTTGDAKKAAPIFDNLTKQKSKDLKVLSGFINIYCRENHKQATRSIYSPPDRRVREVISDEELVLCADCQKLLNHGIVKLLMCTQDPKPMCKKCKVHCYSPAYREQIKGVMRFSGLYLIKHGRVDLIAHYYR